LNEHQVVAGVDLSLNSPAVCIVDSYESDDVHVPFNNCHFHWMTTNPLLAFDEGNLHGTLMQDWHSPQERYSTIAAWVLDILKRHGVKSVGIEGYAYGANTNNLTKLAENCGLLKYLLFNDDIAFDIYAPSAIKRTVCGTGNATKEMMHIAFRNDHPQIDLVQIFSGKIKPKKVKKKSTMLQAPITDIVDSYYIAVLHRVNAVIENREYFHIDTHLKGKEE
jgi:hypothetical protein